MQHQLTRWGLLAKTIFIIYKGNGGIPSLGLRFCPLGDEDIGLQGCRSIAEVAASTTQQSTELKVVTSTVSTPLCKNQPCQSAGRAGSQKA